MLSRQLFMPCFAALVLCFSTSLNAQGVKRATFINTTSLTREDELVVLTRSFIEKKLGRAPHFISLKTKDGNVILQHDDVDDDGKWDEAVFLYSFRPNETVTFEISGAENADYKSTTPRAHVRLRKKNNDGTYGRAVKMEEMPVRNPATDFSKQPLPLYLTEGPGWENDKVAFRQYLDVRNGRDIFGKRVPHMILDSVGLKGSGNYHELSYWGMDILHSGKSLGSGAIALSVPTLIGRDTLIRVGGEHIKKTVYQQISDGPVRAAFKITYDWEIEGRPVRITDITSIWGGQYFYESKISITGTPANTKLITGIADFSNNISQVYKNERSHVLISHGKQSENKDHLGMAVVVSQLFAYAGSAPDENSDIMNSLYVAQKISPDTPNIFRFYAAWEKTDNKFAQFDYFKSMLDRETVEIANPIVIE